MCRCNTEIYVGVLSGAISAMISAKLSSIFGVTDNLQFIVSAIVAALTVGGKAIGKEIANRNSGTIVYGFGKILSKIKNENK